MFKNTLYLFLAGDFTTTILLLSLRFNHTSFAAILARDSYVFPFILVLIVFFLSILFYLFFMTEENAGILFLIFILEGQIGSAIAMTLSSNFPGIFQFGPFLFLLAAVFELGTESVTILGFFSIITFDGMFIYKLLFANEPYLVEHFLYYTISYFLVLLLEQNIGNELSLQFEAKRKLEQVDDLKNQFIALSSHYLRTPLTIIKGSAYNLKQGETKEKEERDIERITTNIEHLDVLIEDLLTITNIEKGKVNISKQPADLSALLQEIINTLLPLAKEKDINITYIPSGIPIASFLFDPYHIERVITSLMDNAIKYSDAKGNIEIRTFLQTVKGKAFVTITIHNFGKIIEEDQLGTLFSAFNRGSLANVLNLDQQGKGLNLYIAKLIIDAHNGVLKVSSHPQTGTTFSIHLPYILTIPGKS